ncbi:creatininase family protein [soil metagenome]
MINEWELVSTNLHRLKNRRYEVAVIPTCAIEAHNFHLPEGQDMLHTTHVVRAACEAAWPRCESVICLPAIPYGVDCNLMDFPLSIHVSQDTLNAMLRDIIKSLRHYGIRKIVLVNGHGGNDFVPFVRQIQSDMDVHVFVCNWWTVGADQYTSIFTNPDDHAGEQETSIALHLFPDLVEPGVASDGKARPFRFEALRKGWVKTSRDFGRLNDHCAVGDPSQANADKGRRYLEIVIPRIVDFLVECAKTPIDEVFPHSEK